MAMTKLPSAIAGNVIAKVFVQKDSPTFCMFDHTCRAAVKHEMAELMGSLQGFEMDVKKM